MPSPAYDRFRASMVMDFDKWHDGLPYDIEALASVSREEAEEIAAELVAKSTLDWRDVEALRALGTPEALVRVSAAAKAQSDTGGVDALAHEIETSGWSDATEKRLCEILERAMVMALALDKLFALAEAYATPAVKAQVFRNARIAGDEATRYAFGAFLLYLNGYADNWYGLDQATRPRLLELNSADYKTYKAAVAWLQDKIDHPRPKARS